MFERADGRDILFDEQWYRNGGPAFEGDAYEHFSKLGWRGGRSPHPLFQVDYYRAQAADLLGPDDNPLEHYLRAGAAVGLDPHPLFDTSFYTERYGNALGETNPLVHYLTTGARSGCDPHVYFVSSFYLQRSPDVMADGENPLVHYAAFGGNEWHRRPHPLFDAQSYARRNKLRPGDNPLVHFLARLHELRSHPPRRHERPDVSAIVLNLNKSLMTVECVVELMHNSGPVACEIVVVDNGSNPQDFTQLTQALSGSVKIVRLQVNRFFGEGNNIGAEASSGRLLLFLNNDAFMGSEALSALKAVLDEHPDAGAVGAKLVYPDGRLQECGALVSSCGTVTQRGKSLDDHPNRFAKTEPVDYVSAACLLMPRALFEQIGGFDLAWDPAYYEDVDLCLKAALIGKRTYYAPRAVVTHIENATSTDVSTGLRLGTVVQINREKFIARWGDYLEARDPATAHVKLPPPLAAVPPERHETAVLFTPYSLVPGGGERYLLTLAQALSRWYRTYVMTPERYSSHRLRTIGEELELDLSAVRLVHASEAPKYADCDVFIAMGNEVLPPLPAFGARRIYVCQFPFPMHPNHVADSWDTLDNYEDVVVYSDFAADHFRTRGAEVSSALPRITVIPPSSPMYDASPGSRAATRILNVGRFAPGGHCKRQDTLVDAFRQLVAASGREDLELHLAGTVSADPDARDFYLDVHARAQGLPVFFHLNAPTDAVRDLYRTSSVYWHATGFGSSEILHPERMEHFGISVVEAMSAGCVPMVYGAGGPAEIVADGLTGFHWTTRNELVQLNLRLLAEPQSASEALRARAQQAARAFDVASFERRFEALLGVPLGAPELALR